MELASGITEPMLSCCELAEVTRCLWNYVIIQLEDDTTSGLRVDCNVELIEESG